MGFTLTVSPGTRVLILATLYLLLGGVGLVGIIVTGELLLLGPQWLGWVALITTLLLEGLLWWQLSFWSRLLNRSSRAPLLGEAQGDTLKPG